MICREFRDLVLDMPATIPSEVLEHTRTCSLCTDFLKRQQELRSGLKQLAAQNASLAAPPHVEATLLREFRYQAGISAKPVQSAARRQVSVFAPLPAGILSAGALAAALAAFLLWNHPPGSPLAPGSAVATVSNAADTDENTALDSGFIPLPYFGNSGLVSEPEADADVVRVQMPRSALVALGVPVAEEGTAGPVEAELLLGAGGMPQAVRVLE